MIITAIKKVALGIFVASAVFVLTGCSQEGGYATPSKITAASEGSSDLKITQWGPQETKAGAAFNTQPDGKAALWLQVSQSLEGSDSVVTMDGTNLTSAISGKLITANVPATFYTHPGVHSVRVVMTRGAQKAISDGVHFKVN